MLQFACALARPGFAFDVAFETKGGVTGLFGPSGSGKSTAIRLLAFALGHLFDRVEDIRMPWLADWALRAIVPATGARST